MPDEIEKRSAERRKRMVGHVAKNFAEAEEWDLEFWQQQTPQARLAALAAIHHDTALAEQARKHAESADSSLNDKS